MKWYIGMLKVFRPSFEVVEEGRIFHFVLSCIIGGFIIE